jgi:hypothetical protein
MTLLLLILRLLSPSWSDQANIPKVDQPDLINVPPALKKAVDEVQKQCPTCATIDLKSGKQAWLTPKSQFQTQSQIDAPDGCTLTLWTLAASQDLKASIEKALTTSEAEQFHQNEPKNCERKAFGYYLNVAKQLLPKTSGR